MSTETVLTSDERDKFVGDLIEYGTDFVAPLYAVVEAIERAVLQSHEVQRLQEALQASRIHIITLGGEVITNEDGKIASDPVQAAVLHVIDSALSP